MVDYATIEKTLNDHPIALILLSNTYYYSDPAFCDPQSHVPTSLFAYTSKDQNTLYTYEYILAA